MYALHNTHNMWYIPQGYYDDMFHLHGLTSWWEDIPTGKEKCVSVMYTEIYIVLRPILSFSMLYMYGVRTYSNWKAGNRLGDEAIKIKLSVLRTSAMHCKSLVSLSYIVFT